MREQLNSNKLKKEVFEEICESEENEILKKRNQLFSEIEELFDGFENKFDFFYTGGYENIIKYNELVSQLAEPAYEFIKVGNPVEVISIARELFEISGIESAKKISIDSPNGAVSLAEAINYGSKYLAPCMYSLKPLMVVAASMIDGVYFGYNDNDGAYSLGTPTIGIASFHDPNDEIGNIFINDLKKEIPKWDYEWSGIPRQHDAFKILDGLAGGDTEILKYYADSTLPEDIKKRRDLHMRNIFFDRGNAMKDFMRKSGIFLEDQDKAKIVYTAKFVKDPKALLEIFPPKHSKIFAHHSTIAFRPKGLYKINIGERTKMKIIGRAFDDKGDALLVENFKSDFENPHITLSCTEDTHPVYSNELIKKAIENGSVEYFSTPIEIEVIEGYSDGKNDILKQE